VSVTEAIIVRKLVIDPSQAVREIKRVCQWYADGSNLNWNAIDVGCRKVVKAAHLRVDVRQETQGGKDRLPACRRLTKAKRHSLQCSVPGRRGNICCRRISRVGRFAPSIELQQTEEECSILENRTGNIASKLIGDISRRGVEIRAFIQETHR